MVDERRHGLRAGVEVISGVNGSISVEIVSRTVDLITARFQSDVHHHSRFFPEVCLRMFLRVELLNGIQRKRAGGRSRNSSVIHHGFAVVRVVVIGAIQNVIVVIWTQTVRSYGVKSTARVALDSGMQLEQV